MNFDYVEKISSLTLEQRILFYERLAHELTISIRGVWSDETITDSEKVERIKWINEIMHQVVAKISVIRLNLHDWPEVDTWNMIKHWVSQNNAIAGEIGAAIRSGYNRVVNSQH